MHHLAVALNGNVYVADTWNNRVRKIDGSSGTISTVIGTGRKGFSGDGGAASAAEFGGIYCLALDEATRVMGQVLAALASAHAVGVVHCDLKPDNILLTADGRDALVLDFGLARMVATATGPAAGDASGFAGTAAYAAPEYLRGAPPTPSSDLYAWGLVFLEVLSGAAPSLEARAAWAGLSSSSTVLTLTSVALRSCHMPSFAAVPGGN